MRLFVTGGSGFLGGYFISAARRRGHDVLALARSGEAGATLVERRATPVSGDLDDLRSLDEAFTTAVGQGAKALVNLASLGFGHAPGVVAAAEASGLRRAVFVSTTAVTTALPVTSKTIRLAAEQSIRESALDWTIVRPTMIYGAPGDRNIARLLAFLRRSPVILVPGGGRRLQQPVHVEDLAEALVSAVNRPVAVGQLYNLAGPEPITFRELVRASSAAVGRQPQLIPTPICPAIAALRLYERVVSRPRLKAEQLERLLEDKVFDITAARADLDFDPRSFERGVREEVEALWS